MGENWPCYQGTAPLQWRHNGRDGVSNHQRHDCLLNRLFRRRSKKTSKLRITGLCVRGIHRSPVNSPHKGPVTRRMFPFEDVIMLCYVLLWFSNNWFYPHPPTSTCGCPSASERHQKYVNKWIVRIYQVLLILPGTLNLRTPNSLGPKSSYVESLQPLNLKIIEI